MLIDVPPFGETLKTLRLQKKMSQQILADKLGVHRNTVTAWERGVYLPASRGLVVEIAERVCTDSKQARTLLEAALFLVKEDL